MEALPLADITVLDLSRALSGPHAGMMLGDLGARVIKVEAPTGDETRQWGPPFVGADSAPVSTYFLSCNRNKESISLDLKDQDDIEVLERLVGAADILIENFRAGVMDRLGLSTGRLHSLNPRLVILSITGFGHDGPGAGRAGYDQIAQGEGGLMSLTGASSDDPQRVGVPIADLLAGIHGVTGALAALHERERTGRGKVVRTSLLAGMVGVHAFQGTRYTVAGEIPQPAGNHHPSIAPYGLFQAHDGAVLISVGNDAQWKRFCSIFDLDPDAPSLATNTDRVHNREMTIQAVESAFSRYDADILLEILDRNGIPAGKVHTLDEVYESQQVLSQNLLTSVNHPTLGEVRLPGSPLRFFDVSHEGEKETTRVVHQPPPDLDANGNSIRSEAMALR